MKKEIVTGKKKQWQKPTVEVLSYGYKINGGANANHHEDIINGTSTTNGIVYLYTDLGNIYKANHTKHFYNS